MLVLAIAGAAMGGCAADPPQFPSEGEDASGSSGAASTTALPGGSTDDARDTSDADDGGAMGSTTEPPGNEGGPQDDTTGEPPASDAAFRLNSLHLVDPHLYSVGTDVTSFVNQGFDQGLNEENPDAPDGAFDFGIVLVFKPLDQSDGAGGAFEIANAECLAPDGGQCLFYDNGSTYASQYTSWSMGPCMPIDESHLTIAYDKPEVPYEQCFVSEPMLIVVETGSVTVTLHDAQITAQYLGDPPGNLAPGVLRGFLSEQEATGTLVSTDLFSGPLSDLLDPLDMDDDGTGWWLYFQLTAVPTEWLP